MTSDHPSCEECRAAGLMTLAAYVCRADHEGLDGPGMGDPDYWPEPACNAPALCETHYALSPPESRFAYTHLNLCEARVLRGTPGPYTERAKQGGKA